MSIGNTNILGTIHSNDKLETDETFSLENKSSENYHIVSDPMSTRTPLLGVQAVRG